MSAPRDPGQPVNVDPAQTAHFAALADDWWDPEARSRPLHLMNPVRLGYIMQQVTLEGTRVLDVGCGAGLLSEAMAAEGAQVTAIDAATQLIDVAQRHAGDSGLDIDYQVAHAEQWCEEHAGHYDAVTCMELLEHVPDPASLLHACATLVRPGGHVLLSTINRTPKAWMLAVVAAEYLLNLLPRGTHEYQRLVRPSEIDTWGRAAGLCLTDLRGMHFNPLTQRVRLVSDVSVNYIAALRRDG